MEFVDIIGYEGLYKINRNGDVLSCRSNKYLKTWSVKGYKYVNLYKDKKKKSYRIHRLVALHFIPNIDNKPSVDHINRNRADNRVENLRWASHSENSINQVKVLNRKGSILPVNNKSGTISHRVYYSIAGEHGLNSQKSKCFKTKLEAEAFRKEIYGHY
jgi:hypothetical protein